MKKLYLFVSFRQSFFPADIKSLYISLSSSVFVTTSDIDLTDKLNKLSKINLNNLSHPPNVVRIVPISLKSESGITNHYQLEGGNLLIEHVWSVYDLLKFGFLYSFEQFIYVLLGKDLNELNNYQKIRREKKAKGLDISNLKSDSEFIAPNLANTLFIFENIPWNSLLFIFDLIRIRIHGGQAASRHLITPVEYTLLTNLLSMEFKYGDIVNNYKLGTQYKYSDILDRVLCVSILLNYLYEGKTKSADVVLKILESNIETFEEYEKTLEFENTRESVLQMTQDLIKLDKNNLRYNSFIKGGHNNFLIKSLTNLPIKEQNNILNRYFSPGIKFLDRSNHRFYTTCVAAGKINSSNTLNYSSNGRANKNYLPKRSLPSILMSNRRVDLLNFTVNSYLKKRINNFSLYSKSHVISDLKLLLNSAENKEDKFDLKTQLKNSQYFII